MWFKRLQTAGAYWVEDQAAQIGTALAYYALFSLAPLLARSPGLPCSLRPRQNLLPGAPWAWALAGLFLPCLFRMWLFAFTHPCLCDEAVRHPLLWGGAVPNA